LPAIWLIISEPMHALSSTNLLLQMVQQRLLRVTKQCSTVLRWCGQNYSHSCQVSSWRCTTKLLKLAMFQATI